MCSCLLHKRKAITAWDGRQNLYSVLWEKSMQGPSDAAQKQGTLHLKGRKIYSLSIFLFLFDFIKKAVLLSCLLLGFSCRDLETALHHSSLSPPHPPKCRKATLLSLRAVLENISPRMLLEVDIMYQISHKSA